MFLVIKSPRLSNCCCGDFLVVLWRLYHVCTTLNILILEVTLIPSVSES